MKRYIVYLTKQCNCRCNYCYQDNFSKEYTWDEIKSVLDTIASENKNIVVELLGGEPFLRFDILKKVYNYLEEKARVAYYYISTNGTLLNDEIINWLKNNKNIILSISLDGTREMNCMRRFVNKKQSYDKVIENIKTLISNGLKKRLMVHMVIHPNNVHYLYLGILHIYNLGICTIDIGIVEKTMKLDKEYCTTFISEHMKISQLLKKEKLNLKITTLEYEPEINKNSLIDLLRKIVFENHKAIMEENKK